ASSEARRARSARAARPRPAPGRRGTTFAAMRGAGTPTPPTGTSRRTGPARRSTPGRTQTARRGTTSRASPLAALGQRRHRQAKAGELLPVELCLLERPAPDDRLAGGVDTVRERHAALIGERGDGARERERDAVEGVVAVVLDDDQPGAA